MPDPHGALKGHPRHLYYTIAYDARGGDVRVKGWKTGGFVYTQSSYPLIDPLIGSRTPCPLSR